MNDRMATSPAIIRRRPGAFTLLEIMLAVAIISMVALALYQFVSATILAARLADTAGSLQTELSGFNRVVQAQAINLPTKLPAGAQLLTGKSNRRNGLAFDSLTWVTPPGNGVFARRADGLLFATLELVPAKDGARLVLSRALMQADPNVPPKPLPDVPLLSNLAAMEIAYYDARINSWVNDWNDPTTLPDLIRFRFQFVTGAPEYETVIRLPPKTSRT
jgi:prepilin-type N-terminal cleavage/methylation domain-containing protein